MRSATAATGSSANRAWRTSGSTGARRHSWESARRFHAITLVSRTGLNGFARWDSPVAAWILDQADRRSICCDFLLGPLPARLPARFLWTPAHRLRAPSCIAPRLLLPEDGAKASDEVIEAHFFLLSGLEVLDGDHVPFGLIFPYENRKSGPHCVSVVEIL